MEIIEYLGLTTNKHWDTSTAFKDTLQSIFKDNSIAGDN